MKIRPEDTKVNSYDDVPYLSQSFAATQAENLKNITRLFDFTAPNIGKARVLEIGCSFGGNLIPMGMENPDMELIGFDLSGVEIKEGNKLIERIGLKNIRLEEKNILDYNSEYGKFDYIICHGVYSWVPGVVQDKILEIVKNSLSENGLAVISYNTNPGWKSLSILRDSMLFREKLYERKNHKTEDYKEIVERGKRIAEFLRDYSTNGSELKGHVENLLGKSSHYIYHEYYEDCNEAFYLYEFQERLEEYGLTHICDSDIAKTIPIYSKDGVDMEQELTEECGDDRIAKEQYYDFLANQQFRSSIVTHKALEDSFTITRNIKKKNLDELYIRQIFSKKDGKFVFEDGNFIGDDLIELVSFLHEIYPENISVRDIVKMDRWEDKDEIYRKVLQLIYSKKVIISEKPFVVKKCEKPELKSQWRNYLEYFEETENPIVSFSASSGVIIQLDQLQRQTLLELDGTKDSKMITDILIERWKEGKINIEKTNDDSEEKLLAGYTKMIFFTAERFGWIK